MQPPHGEGKPVPEYREIVHRGVQGSFGRVERTLRPAARAKREDGHDDFQKNLKNTSFAPDSCKASGWLLDNIAVFVRVVELRNLSAAGRDMRISPAVASNRIKELEKYLGVRLFNRTTRQLMPTEHGTAFYPGAKQVLDAIAEAEAAVAALSGQPRGTIKVTAPLGLGRRLIASGIPEFRDRYPDIEVRLRLSDHEVDIMKEGIDVAFRLGVLEDSSLRMRGIMDCERVLAAAPPISRRAASRPTPATSSPGMTA